MVLWQRLRQAINQFFWLFVPGVFRGIGLRPGFKQPGFFMCVISRKNSALIVADCVQKLEMTRFVPTYMADKLKRMPLCDWIN